MIIPCYKTVAVAVFVMLNARLLIPHTDTAFRVADKDDVVGAAVASIGTVIVAVIVAVAG